MKHVYLLLFLLVMAACKKEKALNIMPELTGRWRTPANTLPSYTAFYIDSKGKGYIQKVYRPDYEDHMGSKKWYIEKNCLFCGWVSDSRYEINQAPVIATQDIIDRADTIKAGQRYMILNYTYYVDIGI